METRFLIGLSRQVALERQLDVVANNVANINTTGYKADNSFFEEYLTRGALDDNFAGAGQRPSYTQDRATWRDLTQGPVERTGNPLDVAINGNGYIAVQTPNGERYTRNGAFQINAQGQLVTADGDAVLGNTGPITFQPGDQNISIARDGTVTVREGSNAAVDSLRGKIRLVGFDHPTKLQKQGRNLYSAPAGVNIQPAGSDVALTQGAIEKSNVNGVVEMSRMIEVMRTYQQVASLLQSQGDLTRTAIERLAEVPA